MAFYADTDFILAIIKEDDWLGSNACEVTPQQAVGLPCEPYPKGVCFSIRLISCT